MRKKRHGQFKSTTSTTPPTTCAKRSLLRSVDPELLTNTRLTQLYAQERTCFYSTFVVLFFLFLFTTIQVWGVIILWIRRVQQDQAFWPLVP